MNALTTEELRASARRLAEERAEPGTAEESIAASAAAIYRHQRDKTERLTEAAITRKRAQYARI